MSRKRRRECARYAQLKDVRTKSSKEKYVLGTVPRSSCAVMKDVKTKLRKEEFV